ncbi:DOCK3 isoform 2 [Pan troglodytes]|uniref:DOCK3 isoform 2 n=1 Tax=Pan troglodytes TaxID=9598 RepID=A0A2J8P8T9_PANTR|nr:DOCK3 isoform 2 [Pan troglodytes]
MRRRPASPLGRAGRRSCEEASGGTGAAATDRQYETVVPLEDSIVTEVTATLQEWASLWKQLYVKHKVDLFYKLRHVMNELIDLRRQLLSGHLTQDQVREVKRHITVRLDWGNEHLGLDLVPRKDFEVVDSDQISVSDLYKMDLSSKDMKRDLYIVAHVIRIGRMLLNDSKKGPPHLHYRRPYGCAVLSILDVLQSLTEVKEEKDFVLKVYTCNNESEWSQIHENIIRKSSAKYSAPSASHGLIISLQLLRGDMEQIRRENPMIFNRGLAITRKLGFPDVIMPGDIRNDLYLTLEKGDFERGGKSVQKNIEVTMYVLYADGEILKDCISLGSGEPNRSSYHSFVLYHSNSPRWGEIIKLPIPIDRFRGSHLRFEFRHCSTKDKGEKKLFGFAFSPLMRDDGTTLSDDIHELYVYKCDENSTFNNHALYLGLPCCKEDYNGCPNIPSSLIFQRSTKESFFISTQLSSTKLTQNVDLLALLKWKAFPDRIMDVLGRLRHVSGEEIVKFLQDILDTLFVILDDNTEKYGLLVFQSLVFIINLLRDIKYFHFRPVMDTYIQKHFAGALAYKELIRCLKWYMDCSAELIRQDHIQEAMRALEYLFKFIVQSRILYSRATCGMEEEQFRSSIQELFQSIRFVLSLDSRNSETLLFTQAALLNSFPTIFDELLQMFTVQEVAEFVRGTLGSMPSTVHIGQSMDVVKLQSIARTVDSRLFSFSESRRILLPVVLHHIHLHLRQQKELLICSGILGSIFSIVKTSSLGEYVSCLLSLLRQMCDTHFQHLLDNFQSKDELKEFLLKIFCVFRNLMKMSVFPRDWMVMRLLTSKYGDMRVMMAYELFSMWQNLGEHKIHFIPGMIGPFLGVTLVPQPEVRNIMIPIFHDMMDWEQRKNGNFKQNFYKSEINKEEMYIRYIHKLCDMHLQAENYTEAAFTLLLYCELLQWEDRPLREFLHYPSQTEWQRKEGLCRKIIHYFNKGKKMEASYYDNIMEQQRLEPEFFRVGFYGRKFPFFLRNKEYVCRGHDYERLEAFQQRMLSEFPQAVAMQHPNHPDDAILQCDAQYLQIYAVTPIPDYVDVLQMDRVPDRVKSFYRVNNVRKFRYDRPFHKGPKDKENEFKVEVSPLENAIQVVENKNQELRSLISQYQHKQVHGNINLLSMCLNGVIDAAVNGGIARYQEAFFDKDYINKHPGDAEKITQLKELMQEQVHVLGVGLAVHEKFVHPEMRPLHKKLIDQFQMMRASLYHEFPGLDKLSPACSGTNTPRGNVLASHSPMSPESIKMTHRHSPMNLMGTGRHSSSSLSSHASSEAGNMVMLGDGSMGDAPEDLYHHMQLAYPNPRYQGSVTNVSVLSSSQASPSSSSLSSTHSAPSQMITSAPSSARDKYRHAREMMLLLPTYRDRPSSAMYPAAILENGQPPNFQRALFQQVVGACKPCSDPNLSVAEKAVPAAPSSWSLDSGAQEAQPFLSAHMGHILAPPVPPRSLLHGHYSLHFDAFHHPLGDTPPALPARTLRKSPLHPIPASPTSPQSGLDGSNSTLSGSASSGVSSLSESNFGHSSEAPPRTDTMDSMPSQAWNADEDLEPPYLPVHYSLSESAVLDSIKAQPCRSHSAPGCVIPQDPMDPPALPPKPYHPRLPALEHDEGVLLREETERPRGLHRKAPLPPGSAKEEQARMAWEHGRGEQ